MPGWQGMAVCVLLGTALVFVHAAWLLPRLPEPVADPEEVLHKRSYRSMASREFIIGCALAAVLPQIIAANQPVAQRAAWVVVGSSVLVLVLIDLRSTWLPKRMQRWCTAELALALLTGALLQPRQAHQLLFGAVIGATAAGVLFWAVWRFSRGGIGFGDVRLVALLSAVAATGGESRWWAMLFLGNLCGVCWGVLQRGLLHRREFPFGPSLWLGSYLALLVS